MTTMKINMNENILASRLISSSAFHLKRNCYGNCLKLFSFYKESYECFGHGHCALITAIHIHLNSGFINYERVKAPSRWDFLLEFLSRAFFPLKLIIKELRFLSDRSTTIRKL